MARGLWLQFPTTAVIMVALASLQLLTVTSIWVFLLLSVEAVKMYQRDPYFKYVYRSCASTFLTVAIGPWTHVFLQQLTIRSLGTFKISTWISPLVLAVLIAIFIPGTSFLGHLCGCAVGYAGKSI